MSFVCWCVFVFGLVNGQPDFPLVNIRWASPPQAFHTLAHQVGDVERNYDEMELSLFTKMTQQMNSNLRHAIKEIDLVLTDVERDLEELGQHSGVKHGAVHKAPMTFMSKKTNTNASPVQTFRVSVAPQPKLPIEIKNKVRAMASQSMSQNTYFFDEVATVATASVAEWLGVFKETIKTVMTKMAVKHGSEQSTPSFGSVSVASNSQDEESSVDTVSTLVEHMVYRQDVSEQLAKELVLRILAQSLKVLDVYALAQLKLLVTHPSPTN